ncbi:MAG: flagellar hook-basal body complex protein FliE [Myxococcales bacterium]|nr:flagellar hook-basal body complex protein FliE [Myxococcales bacterium]
MNVSPPSSIPGIADIAEIRPVKPITTPAHGKVDLAGSFAHALEAAHATEQTSTHAAEQFAKGDPGIGIHEVMIASEQANISLRYATTLKNKALEAYRELMNTQV